MYLNIGILEKIMNNLASMTGYSHIKGSGELGTWIWEIKTVNSRGLDVRCRLGHSLDSLEPEIRRRISDKIHRASVTVSLRFSSNPSLQKVIVNRDLVQQILDATSNIAGNIGSRPSLDAIFTVPGIVSILNVEDESKNQDLMHKDLLKSFDKALDKLRKSQLDEGNKIFSICSGYLDKIESINNNLSNAAYNNPINIRDRLIQKLAEVIDTVSVSEDRLAQEVALLAIKSDIREEIDRIGIHLVASRKLLLEGGGIGRKLDFLSQEFSREANTICSKSTNSEISGFGLDLKSLIERFREQIQNLE